MTRPPWPGRFPAAAAVAPVALVAVVAVVSVAAVVGVTAVVVVVDAAGKTNQWYLDPAPLAGLDL